MELRHLRYFVAVATEGHVTRAAQQLGMQQPPLSQQIRTLERGLGLPLFRRHAKGVTLTEAGRQLLPGAQALLERADALRQRMQRLAEGRGGELVVGFTSSAAAHAFTPRLLRACRREHPDIELKLVEANAAELIEAVAAERLHCGFVRVPVAQPPGVLTEALLTEAAVLALPIDHPLALSHGPRTPVPWRQLAGQRLILVRRPGAPGLYARLLSLLEQQGVPVEVVAEVERMMTNLNLVASGAGISIVPESMRGTHPASVAYRPLPRDAGLEAPLTLVYRGGEAAGPAATFCALARQAARAEARPGARRRWP